MQSGKDAKRQRRDSTQRGREEVTAERQRNRETERIFNAKRQRCKAAKMQSGKDAKRQRCKAAKMQRGKDAKERQGVCFACFTGDNR
jgi:hypothetical protein